MSKFTPGPWRAIGIPTGEFQGNWDIVANDESTALATVWNSFSTDDPNARLIAAAPTLYEACLAAVKGIGAPIMHSLAQDALHKVAAAIALAENGHL